MVSGTPVDHQLETDGQSLSDIRSWIDESLQQLSLEKLRVIADFAAYLADAESEAATQELIAIPGLLEHVNECRQTPKDQYVDWRAVRSDV